MNLQPFMFLMGNGSHMPKPFNESVFTLLEILRQIIIFVQAHSTHSTVRAVKVIGASSRQGVVLLMKSFDNIYFNVYAVRIVYLR